MFLQYFIAHMFILVANIIIIIVKVLTTTTMNTYHDAQVPIIRTHLHNCCQPHHQVLKSLPLPLWILITTPRCQSCESPSSTQTPWRFFLHTYRSSAKVILMIYVSSQFSWTESSLLCQSHHETTKTSSSLLLLMLKWGHPPQWTGWNWQHCPNCLRR